MAGDDRRRHPRVHHVGVAGQLAAAVGAGRDRWAVLERVDRQRPLVGADRLAQPSTVQNHTGKGTP